MTNPQRRHDISDVAWALLEPHLPGHGPHKRGLNSKIHLAVDAHGMPVGGAVTAGTTADCTQAVALIDGIAAHFLLAERTARRKVIMPKSFIV